MVCDVAPAANRFTGSIGGAGNSRQSSSAASVNAVYP